MHEGTRRAGEAVRIRGERWRVVAEHNFDPVAVLEVEGCDATNRGTTSCFITPFERIDALTSPRRSPRIVTMARWRRAARAALAGVAPCWTSLRAATRANLTILRFQLEPAIAVTRGDTCRVLLADAVGLGKTIQAALIVAETIARTPDARVLIVCPAGLRDQWTAELDTRFGLRGEVLDAEGIARHSAQLVPDVNPWSIHAIAITSIDYVKRPEVMRSLETLTWDVVVFDEAHALTGRSDRAAAAAALARRARVLVLMTATPHSGDAEAFARLCALGDLDEGFPLMTFRRTRADVGLPHGRRTVALRVGLSPAEAAMHRTLADYARRLGQEADAGAAGAALVGSILARRACSSASSLVRSLERRKALLGDTPNTGRDQPLLPFADEDTDEEPAGELAAASLRDAVEESRWLDSLIVLGRAASANECKVRVLTRLIRRAGQPVLVFTEYRDTLQHLADALSPQSPLQLHGGLTQRERADVVRRFTSGEAAVLLATDAASEGLNLHQHCRIVINLELPWTPLRLEQRIGRVDRLGQRRRVHAIQLVARATAEEAVGTRLDDRSALVRAAFDSAERIDGSLAADARREATRLISARALGAAPHQDVWSSHIPVAVVPANGREGWLWAFRLSCVDESCHAVFDTIVGVIGRGNFASAAAVRHEALLTNTTVAVNAWLALATRRETAIVNALRHNHARLSAPLLQPGLFDRRAERAAAVQAARLSEVLEKSAERLRMLARLRRLRTDDRSVVFGVTYRP